MFAVEFGSSLVLKHPKVRFYSQTFPSLKHFPFLHLENVD